jgi:hypothetical protein
MADKKSIELKFIDSIGDDDLLQNAEPLLELGIDKLMNNPLVEKLPVVSIGLATGRSFLTVRDYLFAKKVLKFLVSAEQVSADERQKFLSKLGSRKKKAEAGLAILELIDKAKSENKAAIIGDAYKQHILGKLKYADFLRIAEMIVDAYSSDLAYFFRTPEEKIGETGDEVEHLLALGFYDRNKHKFGNTVMSDVQPVLSSYGKLIMNLRGNKT